MLLPHADNIRLSDSPYGTKRNTYKGKKQNLLARSLAIEPSEEPGFHRFVRRSRLPFRPHEEFRLADLQARGRLYGRLAKRIWSFENIRKLASS